MKSFLESFISKIVIVVILATSFTAIVFAASIPTSISYQGTMVAKGGGVVTGRKTIKFAMYSTTTGSVPFWSENHPNVTVSNSQFAAQLGQINPLPVNFFTGQTYLGLSVESDSEMVPRQQLVSVPYAYSAVNAVNNRDVKGHFGNVGLQELEQTRLDFLPVEVGIFGVVGKILDFDPRRFFKRIVLGQLVFIQYPEDHAASIAAKKLVIPFYGDSSAIGSAVQALVIGGHREC